MAATAANLAVGAGRVAAAPLNALGQRHLGGLRLLGLAMGVSGLFIVVGAFTGRLAPMIAALFYPDVLTGTSSSSGGGKTNYAKPAQPGQPGGIPAGGYLGQHTAGGGK